jgi:O-antigen/teichoic acid export membrane protein
VTSRGTPGAGNPTPAADPKSPQGEDISDAVPAEAVEDNAEPPPIAAKPAGRFGRDALTVANSRLITRAATFVTGIVIARLLGPEGRGLVAALTVPAGLAASLAELGTRQATAYHVGRNTFPLPQLVATLLGMLPFASALAILGSLGYYRLSNLGSHPFTFELLAVAAVPSSIGTAYVTGVLLGRGKITRFSRASWMPAVITLLFVLIGAWGLGWNIRGILIGTALGNAVGFGYALSILRKEAPLAVKLDRTIVRAVQRLGLTYALATFVLLLLLKVMILLLSRLSTLAEVGLYAQAAAIAEIVLEIPTMMTAILFSRAVMATDKDAMSRKVATLARVTLVFTVMVSMGVGITAPFIFPLIYGESYAASGTICILLLPGVVGLVFFRLIQQDIHARGKAWITTAVAIPTLILTVAMGYVLALEYGAAGAAVASSTGYVLAAIVYAFAYTRLIGITMGDLLRFRRSDFDLLRRSLPIPARFRR